MTEDRTRRRRGFSMLELLVVMTIITVVASLVIPAMRDDSQARLIAAAIVLHSDIEYAQVATIAKPDDPVVVRFDTANGRYWLALESDPATPLVRDDTGDPYLVAFGAGRGLSADGVSLAVTAMANDTLVFNSSGAIDDFTSTPEITVGLDGEWIRLTLAPTTGTITESSGSVSR